MPDNSSYIVAAYVVTWFTLLAYTLRLHLVARRAKELAAEAARGPDGGRP
jgi:hypothetical protein